MLKMLWIATKVAKHYKILLFQIISKNIYRGWDNIESSVSFIALIEFTIITVQRSFQ